MKLTENTSKKRVQDNPTYETRSEKALFSRYRVFKFWIWVLRKFEILSHFVTLGTYKFYNSVSKKLFQSIHWKCNGYLSFMIFAINSEKETILSNLGNGIGTNISIVGFRNLWPWGGNYEDTLSHTVYQIFHFSIQPLRQNTSSEKYLIYHYFNVVYNLLKSNCYELDPSCKHICLKYWINFIGFVPVIFRFDHIHDGKLLKWRKTTFVKHTRKSIQYNYFRARNNFTQ